MLPAAAPGHGGHETRNRNSSEKRGGIGGRRRIGEERRERGEREERRPGEREENGGFRRRWCNGHEGVEDEGQTK
jgi:hypothetical protein